MDPISFYFFGRPIYWYGVSVAAGFLLAVLLWSRLGRHRGYPDGFASEMAFWLIVSGILGARLAYVAANAGYYLSSPFEILRFDKGGLIYYGGFLGGAAGLVMFSRKKKKPFFELMDFGVPGLAIGHAMGRIGCFMNGCCFGRPWDGASAVTFPPGSEVSTHQAHEGLLAFAGQTSLPVHPVQLYEAGFNIVLSLVLARWAWQGRMRRGMVSALYLLIYPVFRFLNEFLRGDTRQHTGAFTTAQALSIVLFVLGIFLLVYVRRKKGDGHDG